MKAGLILIGNELLNGKIHDLNTQITASLLFDKNITLEHVSIVKDEEKSLHEAIEYHSNIVDIIITSGGLGPTEDDKTKKIIANFFKKPLKENPDVDTLVQKHFIRGKRKYDKDYMHYHIFPTDAKALFNHVGYAPGIFLDENNIKIFALPGVPKEFESMLSQEVLPIISSKDIILEHLIVKTWKLPESKIFNELCPGLWKELSQYGEVSSLPHSLGVDIGISIKSTTEEKVENIKKKVLNIILKSDLKEFIWHIGPEKLEEVIISEAKSKELKIGFAESCTGGLLASRITDFSGSSSVFWGSIISYSNEVKIKSLNVKEDTLKQFGAVSEQTALEMATGAKDHLDVDIAITTTGIAGPGGGSVEKPVGTVGIGVSSKLDSSSKIYQFSGNRKSLKLRFSQVALMTLLEEIRKH